MIDFKQILEDKLARYGIGSDIGGILTLKIADETGIVTESTQLLVENRLNFIKDSVRGKMDFSHDPEGKIKDSDNLIDHIASKVDPTSTNAHTQWVMNQYRKGAIRQEDFPRVKKALKGFETVKKNLANKDVNQFKGVSDLEDHVATQLHRTKEDIAAKKTASSQVESGLEHKFSEDGVTGFKIPNKAASVAFYGPAGKYEKTRWCTAAAGSNNMFNQYKGGKYTVHTPNNDVLQFHHNSSQIMDKDDHHVNLSSDPRFKPYAEPIKRFITQTAKEEGFQGASPLMLKTGSGMSKEETDAHGAKLVSKIHGDGWINHHERQQLGSLPFSEEHLHQMTTGLLNNKDLHDRTYSTGENVASIASNDNLPAESIKAIHEKIHSPEMKALDTTWQIKNNLAKNENLPHELRKQYSGMEGFASRRDLSHEEMHNIVKEGDHIHTLLDNMTVHLPHDVQHEVYKNLKAPTTNRESNRYKLSSRSDLHPDAADALVKDHPSASDQFNYHSPVDAKNLAKTSSPEVAMKHFGDTHLANHVYKREDVPEEAKIAIVKSGHLKPADINKEHASAAVESGKYSSGQQLDIPGISKEHADAAAKEVLSTADGTGGDNVYTHPKVSDAIKREAIKHIHLDELKNNFATAPHSHIDALFETGDRAKISQVPQFKNVQKSHFDKLAEDNGYHAAIVNSKAAPPSILAKLANSPSDYIRSKVAAHKNTPADVKSSITFDSSKV